MAVEFRPGDQAVLARGVSETEKYLIARGWVRFRVKRIDETHGYIVVQREDMAEWHVHPEALDIVGKKSLKDLGRD